MSNLSKLCKQCGHIPTIEISKHDVAFEYLYSVLEKHPMMLSEWNAVFRNRSNVNTYGRDMLLFEHWVSRHHPGHMPYMSTWDELDGCTRASWRQHSDKTIPSHNTVFVCLLGILYSR